MAEVGRVSEAMQVARTELLPDAGGGGHGRPVRRKQVCFEVMCDLAQVVRERHGESSAEARDFAALCQALDESTTLVETTLEDMVLEPILPFKPSKSSSRKPPPRWKEKAASGYETTREEEANSSKSSRW